MGITDRLARKPELLPAIVVTWAVAMWLLPHIVMPWANEYERFICCHCGMTQSIYRRWRYQIPTKRSVKHAHTRVSVALRAPTVACEHEWTRVYFDYHSPKETAHGGTGGVDRMLVNDSMVANELENMADEDTDKARETWEGLFLVASGPRNEARIALECWILEGWARGSVAGIFEQVNAITVEEKK